jgi:hypothetical protein
MFFLNSSDEYGKAGNAAVNFDLIVQSAQSCSWLEGILVTNCPSLSHVQCTECTFLHASSFKIVLARARTFFCFDLKNAAPIWRSRYHCFIYLVAINLVNPQKLFIELLGGVTEDCSSSPR